MLLVQIHRPQLQRAAAPARGLLVQPQDQRIQDRIVATGSSGSDDVGQPVISDRVAVAGLPSRFCHLGGWVSGFGDVAVGDGAPVQAAHRPDKMLLGARSAAIGAPLDPASA